MPKTKIIVDTPYLIWDLQGHPNFDTYVQSLFKDETNEFYICTISYWEIAMLASKKRIHLNQSVEVFCQDIQAFRNYKTVDMTPEIAGIVSRHSSQINGDPADRIIAATSISMKAKLLTKDRNLTSLSFLDTI